MLLLISDLTIQVDRGSSMVNFEGVVGHNTVPMTSRLLSISDLAIWAYKGSLRNMQKNNKNTMKSNATVKGAGRMAATATLEKEFQRVTT